MHHDCLECTLTCTQGRDSLHAHLLGRTAGWPRTVQQMLDLLNSEDGVRRLLKFVDLVTTTSLPIDLVTLSEGTSHRSAIDETTEELNLDLRKGPVCSGTFVADALEPKFFQLTAPSPGMKYPRQAWCQDCGARVSCYKLAEAWALRHCSPAAEEAFRLKMTENFEVNLAAVQDGDLEQAANLTLITLAHCVHLPGHSR